MTKPKKKAEPIAPIVPVVEGAAVLLPDAGASLYRDRAGKPLGGGLSEGKANFGAITEAARAAVVGTATVAVEDDDDEDVSS